MTKQACSMDKEMVQYFVYILRCQDNTLYTGITVNLQRRIREHFAGGAKCAKYTRVHRPVRLEAVWCCQGRSAALKQEYWIKQQCKQEKERLIRHRRQQTESIMRRYVLHWDDGHTDAK